MCVTELTHCSAPINLAAALSLPPYQRGDRNSKFLFSKSKLEFMVLKIKCEVQWNINIKFDKQVLSTTGKEVNQFSASPKKKLLGQQSH